MKKPLFVLASLLAIAPLVAIGCGGDNSATTSNGDDAGDDATTQSDGGGDASKDASGIDATGSDAGTDGAIGNDSGDDGPSGDGTTSDASGDGASNDGSGDASTPDSSTPDASTPDSSTPDASTPDSSTPDSSTPDSSAPDSSVTNHVKTVFVILMENHSLGDIQGNSNAPYYNGTLIPAGARALNYKTPAGNHPSEPNYLWLESGTNFNITDDNDPSSNHQSTTDHLVTQLKNAGVSWKTYVQSKPAGCPVSTSGLYAAKHTPFVFFDDVTDGEDAGSQYCIDHVRDLGELTNDLQNDAIARYNFITPDLCHDMHGDGLFGPQCAQINDSALIKAGDDWLKQYVHAIMQSNAYTDNGAIFILWDEGSGVLGASDGPVPFLVLSPLAKTNYSNMTAYTHSSMLRTVETIFGVSFLRDAANASDLRDLFTAFP
jgi:hypothetical protein